MATEVIPVKKLPTVLVVEDEKEFHRIFRTRLKGRVTLIVASDLDEAYHLFIANPNFAAIVVDACVPGNRPNALWLVVELRRLGYQGPMVAISSLMRYRIDMLAAGCDHECLKLELPEKVCQVLHLR